MGALRPRRLNKRTASWRILIFLPTIVLLLMISLTVGKQK